MGLTALFCMAMFFLGANTGKSPESFTDHPLVLIRLIGDVCKMVQGNNWG